MKFLNYNLFLGLFLLTVLFSCNNAKTGDGNASGATKTTSIRPYSPWVFRSVLDNKPRMITLALDKNLYASYSTQTGGLYKAWKGNVLLEGAVYNSAHGPQPLTLGDAYFINKFENPWIVKVNGEQKEFFFQYKGHHYIDPDHAELMYELTSEGKTFEVREQPEVENKDSKVNFTRTFTTNNMPEGYELYYNINVSSITAEDNFSSDGTINKVATETRKAMGIEVYDIDAEVLLNRNGKTAISVNMTDKALLLNPNNALISAEEMADNEGKELIGKNDCKSCHNTYVKTIGPSYTAISKKYATSDDNIFYLANKVLNGGAGIWGNVPMSAHPELAKEDAQKMVRYILELDKEDEGEKKMGKIEAADFYAGKETVEGLIPGALVRVYNIPSTTRKMPDYSKLKAIMGGVLPNFDNLDGGDFVGLEDNFGILGEGYLEILEEMEYSFRMWSDDGSKLYIDDQLVVDNDGNHGTEFKENKIGLKKGYHSFRVEFYQGGGGKFLSFNWKPANAEIWAVVPREVISHLAMSHSEIKGLTLPMSSVTQIPGDGISLTGVHPSFTLKQIRPDVFLPKVGGLDVLKDGRVILSTWDPEGAVYIIDYKNAKTPNDITFKKIASGLAEPLGVKVVGDDIYVMQKQEMTHLIDLDGDEIIDEYRVLSNSWAVSANFHEFGFGLEEKDGYLYANLAIGIMPGGASAPNQPKDRGKAIRVNRKTGELEIMAHGLRTPNGVGLGFNDEIYIADNQGDWLPASKILHLSKDAFFNSRAVDFEGTAILQVKQPVVWLPQDEIGNSPSTPAKLNVGPYKNQMIHGEVTHGGLKRVFVEEVNGEFQGALFRFSQGFDAGINRISWADDETLIVGGIGNPGNWQHSGRNWYGLEEFKFNGQETFEMLAIRAKTNGIEIEFTQPLQINDGGDPQAYNINQYYFNPTADYGGPKLGQTDLKIKSTSVSTDRTKVFLEVQGMKEGHVLHLTLKEHFVSSKNQDLWSTESWYTMNSIPKNTLGEVLTTQAKLADNTLSEAEKAAGWKLLFNGQNTDGIRNFKKQTLGSSWKVKDGVLFLDSQKKDDGGWQAADGGDIIITDKEYENYEFSLEWKISNCGNSGIIYNINETGNFDYVWQTGPEMQILDNTCHPDTKFPTHRAGDLYDLKETKFVTVKTAGEWNKVLIVSKGGVIQHWLNGYKVVEYNNQSPEWAEMISKSKFKEMPGFGKYSKGLIALQDHGDPVYFRNIKIREL